MEVITLNFIDIENNVTLGKSKIPYQAITKLAVGDIIEFKEAGAIFGFYKIQSFAVNQGFPEGDIKLLPIKSKAKIKLQEINDQYLDSLLPF